ncbi:MAG: biotin--[acetyl-CoA-carboxylase] ligase [Thiohalospira sp.]
MTTRLHLYHLLSDGDWHAGPALAASLGISRAAVAKAVNALEGMGLEVERGRSGYRIPAGALPPRADTIARRLSPSAREHLAGLQSLHRVDSTNSWLLRRRAADGEDGSQVCIAAHQTAGRGRLGRSWDSPAGPGLYLSVSLGCAGAPAPAMALAMASLAAAGIEDAVPAARIGLKWPNDLLLDGAKLGGILMESRGEYGGQWQIVIGLGLNLTQPVAEGRTSLAAAGLPVPRREELAASLLGRMLPGAPRAAADPRPWLADWRSRDYFRGAEVRVQGPGLECQGVAAGIESDGALRLETADGPTRVTGGDVSLRGR